MNWSNFQQEKERVRAINRQKSAACPKFRTKLINAIFVAVIAISVVLSIVGGKEWRVLMIELATITLSAKIIYLIHCQMRINQFELWILSSLEWRLTEMMKHLRQLTKE